MPYTRLAFVPAALVVLFAVSAVEAEGDWPRWRGPQGDGHSRETGLRVEWSKDSVTWKTRLKGEGHSSPVVQGERIFLTTALDEGRQRMVVCLDRNDGRILWEQIAWTGEPEPTHKMTGWAAATCVTDGERVYAFFGRGGLHCYTVDGEHVWSKDLGVFEGPWGTAASPVIVGDLVIQNCDADRDAYIIALDKRTGRVVWKTDREDYRGWSTPVLIQADERDELVLNGHTGVRAYDPETGRELWYCAGFAGRGEPTATPAHGLLYMVNGLRGNVYAVRPGGNGTVTTTHRV
jgi:outer membrane protein assembly factor BamB